MNILTFESFAEYLRHLLRLPDGLPMHRDAFLVEDLGLDSLGLAELAAALDETGIKLVEEVLLEMETLGDAYEYYETRAKAMAEGRDLWLEEALG